MIKFKIGQHGICLRTRIVVRRLSNVRHKWFLVESDSGIELASGFARTKTQAQEAAGRYRLSLKR